MPIKFIDLNSQYREVKKDIELNLSALFSRGDFILGEDVRGFEADFAAFCGCQYGVGVNSGTDALFLSLLSLGIGKGDEVIVPAFTFIATALAVSFTGAKPIFADIDAQTYNLDTRKLESAVSKKTKAIIPVHLFGQPADMTQILSFAKAHKLKVIEDACQAHGASYHKRPVGSLGDAGCFSFYPTKNLGGFGDGGMIVTQSRPLFERLRLLRDCGRQGKYNHILKGYNSRLDSVQAAVLIPKLKRLGRWNSLRQKHAQLYDRLLSGKQDVITPFAKADRTHVYHVYSVRVKNRDRVYEGLRKQGIGVAVYYPAPLHLQKAYQELGCKRGSLPVAEMVCREILALPMHPFLTAKQINLVARRLLNEL